MKISSQITYKNTLTKLNLLNTKIFTKKILDENIHIEDIKYQLKKALQIIYNYYVTNKKILFIGGILPKLLKQLKNSNHTWVSEKDWLNGVLTNNIAHSSKKNPYKSRLHFQKKYNLIVIFGENNKNILEESYTAKIPTISLNTKKNINNTLCCYKISGNLKFTEKFIRDNFFYVMLETTLKRAHYFKNKKKYVIKKKKQV